VARGDRLGGKPTISDPVRSGSDRQRRQRAPLGSFNSPDGGLGFNHTSAVPRIGLQDARAMAVWPPSGPTRTH